MAGWIYTERLHELLKRHPSAHHIMCWILSAQQGGFVTASVRQIEHELQTAAIRTATIHMMLMQLQAEQFVTLETTGSTMLIAVCRPKDYGIMPILDKDLVQPLGPSPTSQIYADRRTVLNYYRRICRRGDNRFESEAAIQYWLERGVSRERLGLAVDAYEDDCQAKGRTWRKLAHTFFDPENGAVEEFLSEETEGAPSKAEAREATKKMRDAFRKKEEDSGVKEG